MKQLHRDFSIHVCFRIETPDLEFYTMFTIGHCSCIDFYADDDAFGGMVEKQRVSVADMAEVPLECVTHVSYKEYKENTDDGEENPEDS